MSALQGTTDITLLVNEEKDLYTPFSPEAEFRSDVKSYIRSKVANSDYNSNINLKVICSAPIDEERFRSAVASWINEEKIVSRQESKITNRTLMGMLVIASIFIILSLYMSKRFDVLSYTIIPVLGSVALGRAAGIIIVDLPTNKAKQVLLDELGVKSAIVFELKDPE